MIESEAPLVFKTTRCIWLYLLMIYSGVASYGELEHVSPRLSTITFLVHFGVNLIASFQILCSLRGQLVQMSTTPSSFDHYCISHKLLVIQQLLHPALKFTMCAP